MVWGESPLPTLSKGSLMSKVYRVSDKIHVKIGEIKVEISPLKHIQKAEVQEVLMTGKTSDAVKGAALAIKYALKNIEGVKDSTGKPYELAFGPDKYLTEDSLDDLFNLKESDNIALMCLNLLNGIPDKFTDPSTGKPLKGVSIVEEKSSRKK